MCAAALTNLLSVLAELQLFTSDLPKQSLKVESLSNSDIRAEQACTFGTLVHICRLAQAYAHANEDVLPSNSSVFCAQAVR